jgi:hypothetical protein
MQQSLGEEIVTINSHIVGKIRVLHMNPIAALFPCLRLTLGVTLSTPKSGFSGVPIPTGFQLRDLRGELRLSEHGNIAGHLEWVGHRRFVRPDSHENQISMQCDLDRWRVHRIESWRKGKPPRFWLQLWPSLVGPSEWYDSDIQAFAVEVPQQAWLDTLAQWGTTRWSVLEVPYSTADREEFERALDHVSHAVSRIDAGDYTIAVSECRLAIDAMFSALDRDGKKERFAQRLNNSVPAERAEQYSALLKALKDVTQKPHHTSTDPVAFRRSEALFVVQTVQHVLALVGDLRTTSDPK